MNLLTFLFRLPLFPVQGFVKLTSVIKEEAEREMASPATIRRELEHAERARASGEMSDEQAAEYQDAAFAEFTRARRSTAAAPTDES
ncbi:MAG TPA: gas vesicle protein G [Streptosporangiaceae bacterium]|nr:gas vesicle protein G [Streptosporangiaceae bacterium]